MSCCPKGSAPYLAADHQDEGTISAADGVSYYKVGSGANAVLFIPDVWGWNGGRTRALADNMAKKGGFSVWVPKVLPPFEGGTDDDGLPPMFNTGERFGELFDEDKYLAKGGGGMWGPKEVVPKVQKVIEAMKAEGVTKYGLVGFCYGAWIGMHLSKEVSGEELVCCASPHPSAVQLTAGTGGKFEELIEAQQCPWAFYPAGAADGEGGDPADYDHEGSAMTALDAKFPGKNRSIRYKDMKHGWVSRGSIKDGNFKAGEGDDVKAAVETCVEDMMDFFLDNGLITGSVSMKVTCKKGAVFYINAAKNFFRGVETQDGTKKEPMCVVKISGLGAAVNTAVLAATEVEKEGLATIMKIQTSYPPIEGRGQPRIAVTLYKK